jgi:hypothetical protein
MESLPCSKVSIFAAEKPHGLNMPSVIITISLNIPHHTVDGRNPAPPWMVETLKIMG